jgi:hypothetical protein
MRHAIAFLAVVGLASPALVWAQAGRASEQQDPFLADATRRSITVTGTVVSAQSGSLVLKIDDHGHRIPFSLSSSVSPADLRAGNRVSVRYHPTGSTGQAADAVEVLARRNASQR